MESEESAPVVEPPEVSRARVERARADLLDHGVALMARAVELHERLSVRAVALLEQVADRQAEQEAQLVDALRELAAAKAQAVALESGAAFEEGDDDGREDKLLTMLAEQLAPELKSRAAAMLAKKPNGAG